MRHLLDSHTLLWYTLGDPQLSGTANALILDPANEILISSASYWEIAIKVSIGKLALHQPHEDFMDACLNKYGFSILGIDLKHTARLIGLPFHHKDPFDRLLVAQAIVENIPIVSNDTTLDAYRIGRLWSRKPRRDGYRQRASGRPYRQVVEDSRLDVWYDPGAD